MDTKRKNTILTVIWGLITLGILCFIFSNSLKNGEESAEQSSWFVDVFRAIFDPQHNLEDGVAITIVRKLAHFTEFAALGFSLSALLFVIDRPSVKNAVILPVFCCLLAATTDEFIQSFTGRTSTARDVFIDFAGAVVGILLVKLFVKIRSRKK